MAFFANFNLGLKIHFLHKAQISFLGANQGLISIASGYAHFIDIFSKGLVVELLKYI